MNQTITTICILLLSLPNLFAEKIQEDDQFTKDIRYLFTVSGSEANYMKSISAIFAQFRKIDSDVPEEYWNRTETELLTTPLDDVTEMIIPI